MKHFFAKFSLLVLFAAELQPASSADVVRSLKVLRMLQNSFESYVKEQLAGVKEEANKLTKTTKTDCCQTQNSKCKEIGGLMSSLPTGDVCPPSYRFRNENSCYKMVTGATSWFQALIQCHKDRASLVEIESSQEQNYVEQIIKSYRLATVWMGGHDRGQEGTWTWVSTGSKFYYNDWRPQEPYNKDNVEHCLVYQKDGSSPGSWNDLPCWGKYAYICEKTARF